MKKKCITAVLMATALGLAMTGCELFEDDYEYETVSEEENSEYESDTEDEKTMEEISDESEEDVQDLTEETTENEETEDADPYASYPVGTGKNISFDTVDVYGNAVTSDMIKDAKIVMLNLWEPWCGPCVNEMPELTSLYEDYKDKGLLIVGAYQEFSMDSDVKEIVNKLGISYPIIKCNKSIGSIEQDYVPATFLLDHNGNLITEEPFAGSNDYSGWEEIILEYIE